MNSQVATGLDDAYVKLESGGYANENAVTIAVDSYATVSRHAGIRFLNITIPQGSTITAATLQVYVYHTDYDDVWGTVYGEDIDDAPNFANANPYIKRDRANTSASVQWHVDALGVGWKSPPDLASIIQEIVNRAGWASGNNLVLMILADTYPGSPKSFYFRSYDAEPAYAAKLSITYTLPVVGGYAAIF